MNAMELTNEWNAIPEEEQNNFCIRCVRKALRLGWKLPYGNEMNDATQGTFLRVLQKMADMDKLEAECQRRASEGRPNTLSGLVFRAAHSSLGQMEYDRIKHSVAQSRIFSYLDGNEHDLLESIPSEYDTERSAIFRAGLHQLVDGLDAKDKVIFRGMVNGCTEREIAPAVGISHQAVHSRVVKIRRAVKEIL